MDVAFNTFPEFRENGLPVPKDNMFEYIEFLQKRFALASGQVHLDFGHEVLMDRDVTEMHYRLAQLKNHDSGFDIANAGKGPAHLFILVACRWKICRPRLLPEQDCLGACAVPPC